MLIFFEVLNLDNPKFKGTMIILVSLRRFPTQIIRDNFKPVYNNS